MEIAILARMTFPFESSKTSVSVFILGNYLFWLSQQENNVVVTDQSVELYCFPPNSSQKDWK